MDTETKERPLKVCLLGASFATTNMGVNALTAGTIKCILHNFPRAIVSLLDYGKRGSVHLFNFEGRAIPIPVVNIRFSKRFYLSNNIGLLILMALAAKLIPLKALRRKLLSLNSRLRHLSESDIVASVAGGDSFSDIYGLRRLLYVSLPQVLVLLLNRPLILLPQTLGPFKGSIARGIANYVLARAALVYARDSASLEGARRLLGENADSDRLRFCYDVGFVVDPAPPSNLNIVGPNPIRKDGFALVGLNVSGLLFMGGYSRNNMFGLRVPYDTLVHSLIDFLIESRNSVVLLVPHVFGEEKNSESDAVACEKIFEALKDKYRDRIALVRGAYSESEIKYIIGLCDFFIGSRMHACIAALSQNIPVVPVAYSDKFAGVMEAVGAGSLVVDPRKMRINEILSAVEQAYQQKDVLRRELESKMPQVRATVLDLFSTVAQVIGH